MPDFHPPKGRKQRIVQAWYEDLTGEELASEYGIAPITVYTIWSKAKKAGILPKHRRVVSADANPELYWRDEGLGQGQSGMLLRINAARTKALKVTV